MRSYGQFCGLAFGLDIIGDRWNLLIVRNLILGPQRWKEMRFNLPGIAKNLLSKRLSEMEEAGVIFREGDAYLLSEKGRELEPIIFAIAEWGETHFAVKGGDHEMRKRYLYTSLRRKMKTSEKESRVNLKIGEDILIASIGARPTLIQVQAGEVCDATMTMDFETFAKLIFEGRDWKSLESEGKITLSGSRRVATQLTKVLRL